MATFSDKTNDIAKQEISFKEILEYAPIGILIFQRDWTIKFVNENFFLFPTVLGGKAENVIGKSIYTNRIFSNVDIRPELDLLKKGEPFEKEIQEVKTIVGGKVSLILKGTPLILANEHAGGILILEDLKTTNHETHLIDTKKNVEQFIEKISDFYFLIDTEGNIEKSSVDEFSNYFFLIEPASIKSNIKKLSSLIFKDHLEEILKGKKSKIVNMSFLINEIETEFKINFALANDDGLNPKIYVLFNKINKDDENKLHKDELKELLTYQQIVSSVISGLIAINKNGRIVFWNESASRIFGLTKSEVFGKPINKIFQQFTESYIEKIKDEINKKGKWENVISIGYDEESSIYFEIEASIINEDENEMLFLLCKNVTEKVKNENKLKESEEKFRDIVSYSPDFILTTNSKGFITYANKRFLEVFQFNLNEISKINFRELIDPEYLLYNNFDFNEFNNIKNKTYELPLINNAGRKIFVLTNVHKIDTKNKNEDTYSFILSDITLKKESEKDMMLIRSVFEASVDGIAVIHKKKFVLMNDSFVKMFGYESLSDLLELDPTELVHNKDKWRISNFIDLAEEGKESPARFNFTAIKKDGTTFEAENSVSFYEFELDKFFVWVLRDQTEEYKARQALLESEAKYRTITESINQCIWFAEKKNNELKAVFYSNAIKKITSYEPQDFINDEELWGKIIHPDDVDYVGEKMDLLYEDPIRKMETLEYRIIDKLGNIIWIENKITCLRDERGKIEKVFGIISDITLSKRAEEELKKSTKELRELNDTKDRFISIISHDLRTPFTSIIGFADLLLNDKSLDEEKRNQYIQFIKDSSKSILSLVNSLLDWTRLQTGRIKFEPDRINAKNIVEKSIQILSGAALQKKINLINEIEKDFFIHGDENLLLQAFNNLISNAIKFTRQNGTIKIFANLNVEHKQVEFSVKDDGIGIKKENIEKLFKVDTKFTTSGTAGEKGSGLGLSLVYEIVKKHGGDIWVKSQEGKGTEFTFSIPVASSFILLVDDSKTDRLLYSKLIKSLMPSYNILEAENGKSALDLIKQNLPALVITDHNMPIMNGYDFVKQLRVTELKYKPPVIVLSGDVNKAVESEYKEFGVEYIFSKPVNLAKFKEAIENSLKKAIFS